MAKKKKQVDYLETFYFPGIPEIAYPIYAFNEEGKLVNFKTISYPNPRSKKRYTRNGQLSKRSIQAKIFDAIVNIGYFKPLKVYTEFPIIILNSLRLDTQKGMFYYLDYYFPELRLAVELDSELHDEDKDSVRDEYLSKLGIKVWRIKFLNRVQTQKSEFPKLANFMRETGVKEEIVFDFLKDIKNRPLETP